MALLFGLLLTDLPLALLYSLKAQLRHLAQGSGGPEGAPVSELYDAGSLPRSVAFSLEPEAILQSRAADTHQSGATPLAASVSVALPDFGWPVARGVPPRDERANFRPPPRPYDPLGPPPSSV